MSNPIRTALVITGAALLPVTAAHAMGEVPSAPPSHQGGDHGSAGSPAPVPEPGVLVLFATGLGGLYAGRRLARKKRDDD